MCTPKVTTACSSSAEYIQSVRDDESEEGGGREGSLRYNQPSNRPLSGIDARHYRPPLDVETNTLIRTPFVGIIVAKLLPTRR